MYQHEKSHQLEKVSSIVFFFEIIIIYNFQEYCINNLLLNTTINTTNLDGTFNLTTANTSYALSEAVSKEKYSFEMNLFVIVLSNFTKFEK